MRKIRISLLVTAFAVATFYLTPVRHVLASGVQALASVIAGGTGRSTLGANGVLIGEGTSPVNVSGAGMAGQVFTSNGAGMDPTFQAAAGGGGSGAGAVSYSASGLTITANTYFFPPGGGLASSTTEANVDVGAPAGTFQNFNVAISQAVGMGNSAVFTWRKNGVDQAVTCTISGAAAVSCSDTTHSFTTAAGDLVDVKLVTTGTIVVTPNIVMLTQFGAGTIAPLSGTFSALPATCSVGQIYYFTDSWFLSAFCTATNTFGYWGQFGQAQPAGPCSGWTAVNSITCVDDSAGAMLLTITQNAALNWRIESKNVPGSTPYNIDAFLRSNQFIASSQTSGLYFYDGTKLEGIELLTQQFSNNTPLLRVEKLTNVTTDNSTAATTQITSTQAGFQGGQFLGPGLGGMCLRIRNDGAGNMLFLYSLDCHNYLTLFTEVIGTFLTPTKYGPGGLSAIANLTGGTADVKEWVPSVYVH